jgi:hypothetical protein
MNQKILLILSLVLVLLVSCASQINNTCPDIKCPELNCNDCPDKIEYQTKEVVKTEYKDKIVNKYQCFDGNITNTISECQNIINIKTDTNFESKTNFCTNPNNYDFEKIAIKSYSEENNNNLGETFSEYQLAPNQWYPSIQEGWIGMYQLKVNNEGCTKIDISKIKVSYYLFYDDELIFKQEKTNKYFNWFIMQEDIYPMEYNIIRRGIFYDGSQFDLFKLTKSGDYVLRIKLYYKDMEVDSTEDLITIK